MARHYDDYQAQYGDEPELITEMMNSERIDQALHAIEEANGNKLTDAGKSVFQDISFNSDRLGEEKQKNTILRDLLEDFARDELNLKPSRVGNLDVIGNAYEYLIGKFAAVLSAADQEITTLQQKLNALKQEKKALMQQLLTGKRRVLVDE